MNKRRDNELNIEKRYIVYILLHISVSNKIEDFEIEGQVLGIGIGVGDILDVHKVLSRKLKATEQIAPLSFSRKKLNGFREFWNIKIFITLKAV